jgi:hypothetical protein
VSKGENEERSREINIEKHEEREENLAFRRGQLRILGSEKLESMVTLCQT